MSEKIVLKNLSKKFDAKIKKKSLLYNFTSFNKSSTKEIFFELKNISFTLKKGDVLGIIGLNGSGKTTLLKIISKIYPHDSGKLDINGNVTYIPGYALGINPRLTMKENLYIIGSLFGLSTPEIEKKLQSIIEFSGLKDHLNKIVEDFSTGMVIRLGFSSTIFFLEEKGIDILLLDEALSSGGDLHFTEKAKNKIKELISNGSTVILVSHNLETIIKHSNKVLWLENGQMKKIGNPQKIVKEYRIDSLGLKTN